MKQEMPNFDTLLHLAQHDPQQLEDLRDQLARKTINSAPEPLRKRLRGLQFQIDAKRRLAKTPLSACIHISNMMHQSLEELSEVLNRPSAKSANSHNRGKRRIHSQQQNFDADILPFPNR
jgi:hypothetical protein